MTCTCGHPQERHLFNEGNCLYVRKTEGGSPRYCHCKVFNAKPTVEPDPDFALGTENNA